MSTTQENLWDTMGNVPSGPGAGAPPAQPFGGPPPPAAQSFGPPPTSSPIPGQAPDFGNYEPEAPSAAFSDPGSFGDDDGSGGGPDVHPFPEPPGDEPAAKRGGIKGLLSSKIAKIGVLAVVLLIVAVVGSQLLAAKNDSVTPLPPPPAAGDQAAGDGSGVVEMPGADDVEDLVEFEGETVETDPEGIVLDGEVVDDSADASADDVEAELEAARRAAEEEIAEDSVPQADQVETYAPEDGIVIGDPDAATSSDDDGSVSASGTDTGSSGSSSSGGGSSSSSSGSSEVASPSGPVGRVTVNHSVSCRSEATVYLTAVGKGEVEMSADGAVFSGSGTATTTVSVPAGGSVQASASADDDVQIKWRARGRCA